MQPLKKAYTLLRYGKAFTLMEILIVVVIVGVLAGVGAVAYNKFVPDAHQAATLSAAVQVGKVLRADATSKNMSLNSYVEADFADTLSSLNEILVNEDARHLGVYPEDAVQVDLIDWDGRPVEAGKATVCNEDYTYCVSANLATLGQVSWEDTNTPPPGDIIFTPDPNDQGSVPGAEVHGPDNAQNIWVTPGAENITIPSTWTGSGTRPACEITGLPAGYTYDPVSCTISATQATGPMMIQDIAAGPTHTCALTDAGSVMCFGDNSAGALGMATTSNVCYNQNDYPACSGSTPQGTKLPTVVVDGSGNVLENMESLATGLNFTCAVGLNGSLWCWGDSPLGASNFAQQQRAFGVSKIAAGENSLWILNTDGTVDYANPDSTPVSGRVLLPASHAGLAADLAYANGFLGVTNAAGQLYVRDAQAPTAAATDSTTIAGVKPATLTGGSDQGAMCYTLTASPSTAQCLANHDNNLSGTSGTQPTNPLTPRTTALGATVVDLALNADVSCAVLSNGNMRCWGGSDSYGQRGDGTDQVSSTTLSTVWNSAGTLNLTKASGGSLTTDGLYGNAGYGHMCAIADDGTARCWGGYSFGEIGDGTVPGDFNAQGQEYPDYRVNPATVPVPVTEIGSVLPRTLTVSWLGTSGVTTKTVTLMIRPTTLGPVPGLPYFLGNDVCTGGDTGQHITDGYLWTTHVFDQPGNFTLSCAEEVEGTLLVVAGGGGGGSAWVSSYNPGGGGAGALYQGQHQLNFGDYPITVGAGGVAQGGNSAGTNGGHSSFGQFITYGGGGGGAPSRSGGAGLAGGFGGGRGGDSAASGAGTYGSLDGGLTTNTTDIFGGPGIHWGAGTGTGGGISFKSAVTGELVTYSTGGPGDSNGSKGANPGDGGYGGTWQTPGGNGADGLVAFAVPVESNYSRVPYAIKKVNATPRGSYADLTWAAPRNGGDPITSYRVQYSSDGGSTWQSAGGTADTSMSIGPIANGTYTFRVRAVNRVVGTSSWSLSADTINITGGVYAANTCTGGATSTYVAANGFTYQVHVFSATGTDTLSCSTVTAGNALVVAGGGSGGSAGVASYKPGGGGAGAMYEDPLMLASGNSTVAVGAGGIAIAGNNAGVNGGNSRLGDVITYGGGGGGRPSRSGGTGLAGGFGGGRGGDSAANGAGTYGSTDGGLNTNTTDIRGGAGTSGGASAGRGGGAGYWSSLTGTNTRYSLGGPGNSNGANGVNPGDGGNGGTWQTKGGNGANGLVAFAYRIA